MIADCIARGIVLGALLATVELAGCAALASDEATVGCQAADAATTAYALHHGAVEANPLMAKVLSVGGIPGLFLAKAILTVAILKWAGEAKPAINGATCGIAVHNLLVIR